MYPVKENLELFDDNIFTRKFVYFVLNTPYICFFTAPFFGGSITVAKFLDETSEMGKINQNSLLRRSSKF